MKEFNYVITDEVGIHARPAGLLVKEAKKYQSAVTVSFNGKKADARKLMALMAMGIKKNDEVTVSVEGEDEENALAGVRTFFENNL
ncbi:phosphocarrier, HPr family [Marvinbryantia formatexigens DSM 14469]|uniref:Phosphocarrier, HPr family n=1 Tax=Marvinbryantia formatexigens DSM 14469 TaxID=478749 RepID=C6LE98_9FIRM|nr:HPr family phosphocarrier protein [Marvinbryantia formatexigens]EET60881.1 phosphocarrier, HPr family [Marvinbryantia formatexigens DSM 14469]UWO24813.1 HPr family phosphocarrier protein [Marvinbryantia formatexigens DSM 14469]SDF24482.1 phosphocarrier protein [Marvinbryantia formatexigens]